MSEDITISVAGLQGIGNALSETIPQHFQGALLQKLLALAAAPIIKDAKARAPVLSGTMKGDIYSFKDKRSTPANQIRGISVRKGKHATKTHGDAYYWPWIEYGHAVIIADGKTLGNSAVGYFGKTVKAYPAHPFMRPAYEAQKNVALQTFQEAAKPEIAAAAAKARSNGT